MTLGLGVFAHFDGEGAARSPSTGFTKDLDHPHAASSSHASDLGALFMSLIQARDCTVHNSANVHFGEVSDGSLLSAAEERSLAEAIHRGDLAARERLIQANLRLVVKIARGYQWRGMVLDDLVGEGNLGLIRAAEEFDPDFGTRFSTYASFWIKQAIRQALLNTTQTIRLPAHVVGLLTKWKRMERALTNEFGFTPHPDQVAIALGLTDSQRGLVESALRASQLRFECTLSDDENAWSADEATRPEYAPDAAIEADEERENVLRRLRNLEERERKILTLRFGLDGGSPMTLREVGKRLGMTREGVRKIEIRAVKKLERPSASSRPVPIRRSAEPACDTSPRRRRHSA